MTALISQRSVEAIAEIATTPKDVEMVFESVGIPFRKALVRWENGDCAYIPDPRSHARATMQAVDLSDPEVAARVLRAVPTLVELHQASKRSDGQKLVRLRLALEAEGFQVGQTSDPATVFSDLVTIAAGGLADISSIRTELRRLEKALPDDPGAAIGRAKNLMEATAKAVLHARGRPVGEGDKLPGLAAKAMRELRVHPQDASGDREQVRRMLGRLQGLVQDIAELRNDVGDGHATATQPVDLETRHGRLAVWSALGWCSFMLDTLSAAGPSGP